jgi:hypothetical protein
MKDDWDTEAMRALMKLPISARRAVLASQSHRFTGDLMLFYEVYGEYNLNDCPIGLLQTQRGDLAVKTEYRNDDGEPLAYLVETGERLCIGAEPVKSLRPTDPLTGAYDTQTSE